jgi:PadR family transcriptional regulator, regulatory protein PadR
MAGLKPRPFNPGLTPAGCHADTNARDVPSACGRTKVLPLVQNLVFRPLLACYISTMTAMATEPKLSHTAALILQTIHAGQIYGFSVMEATGLPSGTVYPAMRRLERDGLIVSKWEQQSIADAEQRPVRKYYKLTRSGVTALQVVQKRYPLLQKMIAEVKNA